MKFSTLRILSFERLNVEKDELFRRLTALLDGNPGEAVKQAKCILIESPADLDLIELKAAILVDGGASIYQQEAIEEGLELFRYLDRQIPNSPQISYNLANAIAAVVGNPPRDQTWLDHQEDTTKLRAEARRNFLNVANNSEINIETRTTAFTNLGNQFSKSYRLGEAHDAWRAAMRITPEHGVAAASASQNLLWLYYQGGYSDLTRDEGLILADIARRNRESIAKSAGIHAWQKIAEFTDRLPVPRTRAGHTDPFTHWLEQERLTLSPIVELVDRKREKLDWLMLPGVIQKATTSTGVPPIFAMFNILKSDFILARDLAWRSTNEESWSRTGRFADTLDNAVYGSHVSALVLAHRSSLDILDKVAIVANYHFELGQSPEKVSFSKLWRNQNQKGDEKSIADKVAITIRAGVIALYGLVELADDYDRESGILRQHKNLRNTGTHRFIVLHKLEEQTQNEQRSEIEHFGKDQFCREVVNALRIARSAIQMLALAISQHEGIRAKQLSGQIGSITIPDLV